MTTTRPYIYFLLLIVSITFLTCQKTKKVKTLPVLGPFERVDGQKRYYPISDFQLINQEGDTISSNFFENQLRVVDFFFISCPTICPKIQAQMLRIHKTFAHEESLHLISHSIDTKRDTVERLAKYARNLGITNSKTNRWQFFTGKKEAIFDLADDYFNIVVEDPNAPEGFNHSGRIVLVDKEGYIRAFANGLDIDSVDRLIGNIQQLLDSYETSNSK